MIKWPEATFQYGKMNENGIQKSPWDAKKGAQGRPRATKMHQQIDNKSMSEKRREKGGLQGVPPSVFRLFWEPKLIKNR